MNPWAEADALIDAALAAGPPRLPFGPGPLMLCVDNDGEVRRPSLQLPTSGQNNEYRWTPD